MRGHTKRTQPIASLTRGHQPARPCTAGVVGVSDVKFGSCTRRITKITKITWFEIHTTTHIIHQKCVYTNVIWIRNGIIGKEVSDV